jgi:hypothetical protein
MKNAIAKTDLKQFTTRLGPAPLLPKAERKYRRAILKQILCEIEPTGVLEVIWLRESVDLLVEVLRLRRFKARLLAARLSHGIYVLLGRRIDDGDANWLADEWAAGKRSAKKKVRGLFVKYGFDMEMARALTFTDNIELFARLDALIASAEIRRNNALREIERYRSGLGASLRRAGDDIIDAECEEVSDAETEDDE